MADGVHVESGGARLLGSECPVPAGELEGGAGRVDLLLQRDSLEACIGRRRLRQATEQHIDRLGGPRGLCCGDGGSVRSEPEQLGALRAEARDFDHHGPVVRGVVPGGPRLRRDHDALAQGPARE